LATIASVNLPLSVDYAILALKLTLFILLIPLIFFSLLGKGETRS